jgi:hypothetical protein
MADVEELRAQYDAALTEVKAKHEKKAAADAALKIARAACISANEEIVAAETAANRKKSALGVAEGWATGEDREVAV